MTSQTACGETTICPWCCLKLPHDIELPLLHDQVRFVRRAAADGFEPPAAVVTAETCCRWIEDRMMIASADRIPTAIDLGLTAPRTTLPVEPLPEAVAVQEEPDLTPRQTAVPKGIFVATKMLTAKQMPKPKADRRSSKLRPPPPPWRSETSESAAAAAADSTEVRKLPDAASSQHSDNESSGSDDGWGSWRRSTSDRTSLPTRSQPEAKAETAPASDGGGAVTASVPPEQLDFLTADWFKKKEFGIRFKGKHRGRAKWMDYDEDAVKQVWDALDAGKTIFEIKTGGYPYRLNVGLMQQQNLDSDNVRDIRFVDFDGHPLHPLGKR